ncbi:MAG: hypothetical protein QM729_21355 [Solirubrobacterales bacterium]
MSAVSLKSMQTNKKKYLAALAVGPAKMGKTTTLTAQCLGYMPGQKYGLVTSPKHLHVIGFDQDFVGGLANFLTGVLKKPEEALDINIYDLESARAKSGETMEWDETFHSAVVKELNTIKQNIAKLPGVHAVIISSSTGLGEGLLNGLSGPPSASGKGTGMSIPKWSELGRRLSYIRNLIQTPTHHTFWEGHVTKGSGEDAKETLGLSGKTGQNFAYNVGHVFKLQREMAKFEGTQVDKVSINTKPTLDFHAGGRGVSVLADKETDLVVIAEKLGYEVGRYGAPAVAAATPA